LLWQINDRYQFPLQLDLDRENGKYLSPDADRSVRNLYILHRFAVCCAFSEPPKGSFICWEPVTGQIEQGTAALAEGWQLPAAAKVEF
jgi:hypothetical protein